MCGQKLFLGLSHLGAGIKLLQVQREARNQNPKKRNEKFRKFYSFSMYLCNYVINGTFKNSPTICFICIKIGFVSEFNHSYSRAVFRNRCAVTR
jgi:hypothetical protein